MLGISFLNELDGELFRDEVQRPWIIRLKGLDVLCRLHPNCALRAARERSEVPIFKHADAAKAVCLGYHNYNLAK